MNKFDTALIFIDWIGTSTFSDRKHAHNFVKYLFSNSLSHTANELTSQNVYTSIEKNEYSFVSSNKKEYNKTKNALWHELNKPEQLYNDLSYIYYYFETEGTIITNIFQKNNEEISCDEIPENFTSTFYRDVEHLIEDKREIITTATNIISLEDTDSELSLEANIEIFNELMQREPVLGKLLCTVSHLDQESMYHIHRLVIQE